jgi:hypothetical protein
LDRDAGAERDQPVELRIGDGIDVRRLPAQLLYGTKRVCDLEGTDGKLDLGCGG